MNTKINNETNIGIDTGQTALDVFVRPQAVFQSFDNTREGINALIQFIKSFKPTRVLIEATGRLEMEFVCAADKLDARDIAHFGEALKPNLIRIKPENLRNISDLPELGKLNR